MMDLHFNQELATGYHSGSQISRVLSEDWMEHNMFLSTPMRQKDDGYRSKAFFEMGWWKRSTIITTIRTFAC